MTLSIIACLYLLVGAYQARMILQMIKDPELQDPRIQIIRSQIEARPVYMALVTFVVCMFFWPAAIRAVPRKDK